MTETILISIIRSCLDQDNTALNIYRSLASSFAQEEISAFWLSMAAEEERHVAFWNALLDFAQQGYLPQIFDDPQSMLDSLTRNAKVVQRLSIACMGCDETNRAFILGYRLEAALMHPAFESLFRFAADSKLPLGLENPEADYENHIQRFVNAVGHIGDVSPEMELIGELLATLWSDTRELVAQAHTDPLTGILNRRGFFKVIDPLAFLCVRNNHPAGLLMIDLDNFKQVNDQHGHQTGDKVLASAAHAIRDVLRRSDVVGRYGGEEFIVFLPECDHENLSLVAEKVRAAIESHPQHGVEVTASVGAAHLEEVSHLGAVERLITRADQCLYNAKKGGRNRVFVSCPE